MVTTASSFVNETLRKGIALIARIVLIANMYWCYRILGASIASAILLLVIGTIASLTLLIAL